MSDFKPDLAARTRDWAIKLTERPSVTGTPDEADFAPWMAAALRGSGTFGAAPEIWIIPVAPRDDRAAVAMLVRGSGRRTILLTGHFDTVSIDDYADLRDVAIYPETLIKSLRKRLANSARTAAERRAKEDFAGDAYLPGRGLLDMKAGLAAGLAVTEHFAAADAPIGNILFIAVPDEENASAGARRAAQDLATIAKEKEIEIVAAINLDAIADDGDGSEGRAIALGTVGKVLPTAFVAGLATHSGFPFNGINAGALIGALATRMEWAPELTDDTTAQPGTPPSLLSIRDGKQGYDVTTPGTAFATWNVLTHTRTPEEIMDTFDRLCAEAAKGYLTGLARRAASSPLAGEPQMVAHDIPVVRYETVLSDAQQNTPDLPQRLDAFRGELVQGGLSLPEQCWRLTEQVWNASTLKGPVIITGFGSIPYLATRLSDSADARHLERIARDLTRRSQERYGTTIICSEYFAGISDMSFLGEAREESLDIVGRNMPVWRESVRWPDQPALAMVPIVNAGPWGRDYHTPLERLHVDYAFRVLPQVLCDIVSGVLKTAPI